jgi:hypothetical protein
MPREFTPKVITANTLLKGDVVYLSEADNWTPRLAEAAILADEADAHLRLLDAAARSHEVVSVYLTDMTPATSGPQPMHFREEFRRTGPSNYFHGKQADLK